ncbi:Homoserine dehydrogenase [hydrothermal vent metagenome]|uniref:Homoserine dehydrogenase n=1 Tax=hydrothermal vent metagenome TaxID=652676 RepID=A0A3B0U697_9ZZZZ
MTRRTFPILTAIMSELEQFLRLVEAFMQKHDWTPTRFGRQLAGDPQFVFDLRAGREPRFETRQRITMAMKQFSSGGVLPVLRIGIAGLGTVGAALVEMLQSHGPDLERRHGRKIEIVAVAARSRSRDRGVDISSFDWYDDPVALAAADNVDLFVELIGGEDGPALASVSAALAAGKPVVTANKALLAKHGVALAAKAEAANVYIGFEAAVAGGIPVIKTLREGLGVASVTRLYGIMNGTCNYILTRMGEEDISFSDCLKDAQALGYAEADPAFDIEGFDTAHKLAILSSLCFGCEIAADQIFVEGISAITQADIKVAADLGYKIKLLGIAQRSAEGIEQRVHPTLVPVSSAIARVDNVLNAVALETDHISELLLAGPGAGGSATAASVLADILDIARGHNVPPLGIPSAELTPYKRAPMRAHEGGYYIRLDVRDVPGALAAITKRFGQSDISLESVIQRPDLQAPSLQIGDGDTRTLVLITQETLELSVRSALDQVADDGFTTGAPQLIRIESF